MSWLEKFNWKPLTPGKLPAGARISAGKSGKVEMSLPTTAEVFVNWVPVNCMPSPESPAKRIVTVSTSSRLFSGCVTGGSIRVLICIVKTFPIVIKGSIGQIGRISPMRPILGGVLIWISLCNLCVLCVSVVNRFAGINHHRGTENTEVAQRRTSNPSLTNVSEVKKRKYDPHKTSIQSS